MIKKFLPALLVIILFSCSSSKETATTSPKFQDKNPAENRKAMESSDNYKDTPNSTPKYQDNGPARDRDSKGNYLR